MQPPRFEARSGETFGESFRHFVMNVVLFTPARVSLIGIGVNLVLCFVLYYWLGWGHVGLALTTGFGRGAELSATGLCDPEKDRSPARRATGSPSSRGCRWRRWRAVALCGPVMSSYSHIARPTPY